LFIVDLLLSQRKFIVHLSKSRRTDGTISIDHLFIESNQHLIIHLAVRHAINSYYIVKRSTIQLPVNIELAYGDRVRIIEP
jgi:hypothetical protein